MELSLTYADYHDPDGTGLRQRDLTVTQVYDRAYLDTRYAAIDANVRALAARRVKVLEAFAPADSRTLLDFGCGTGRVVEVARERGWQAHGCDVVPGPGVRSPAECRRVPWEVVTFFDSLEHLPEPADAVRAIRADCVMVSVPNCARPHDPEWFMRWRHRRPGEHLHHWSRDTLDRFFAKLGYGPVMWSHFEDAFRPNREQSEPNILTAVYRRDRREPLTRSAA